MPLCLLTLVACSLPRRMLHTPVFEAFQLHPRRLDSGNVILGSPFFVLVVCCCCFRCCLSIPLAIPLAMSSPSPSLSLSPSRSLSLSLYFSPCTTPSLSSSTFTAGTWDLVLTSLPSPSLSSSRRHQHHTLLLQHLLLFVVCDHPLNTNLSSTSLCCEADSI